MPLLGWPLVAVLGVLTVAAVAATLLLWARVRGPGAAQGAQRVLLILGCQLSALLVLAAAVNNYGYFYGSWSDLFGGPAGGDTVRHVVASGKHVQALGVRTPAPATVDTTRQTTDAIGTQWSTASQWSTRGRIEGLEVRGPRSHLSGEVLLYLPPQYFQPAYAGQAFPAVEVLTGYPGITRALVDRMHYPDVLLAQLEKRLAHPMVLAMLRPTLVPPRDTECTDVPGGPLVMTYLAEDVPSGVAQVARVRPTDWGAIGDSTGGYCATKLALTHSDVFRAAVSLSGYYHALRDATTGDLWDGSAVLRDLNSPEWLLAHQPPPPVSLLVTIGLSEHGQNGVSDTRRFIALARPPLRVDAVFEPGGGHNFRSWAVVLPTAVDWLSSHLGA